MTTLKIPVTGVCGDRRVLRAWATVRDDAFGRRQLEHRWCRHTHGYACRKVGPAHARVTLFLHQAVHRHYHGPTPADHEIDHANRDKLDCTPENLRAVTHGANLVNAKLPRHNTTGFRGVSRHKPGGKWLAKVQVDNRGVNLGLYATPEAAAVAVNRAYAEHWPHVDPPNRITRRPPCTAS